MKNRYNNIQLKLNEMKKWKTQFRAGAYADTLRGIFKITPCLQITYSEYGYATGFAIELTWGKWGVGCRFYY